VRAALKDATFQQRMSELGGEIVPESKQTSEALKSWLKAEIDRYGPMIKAAGQYAD
jgi:tripartite-type tricarboxylate transporter receptor subunit TctC